MQDSFVLSAGVTDIGGGANRAFCFPLCKACAASEGSDLLPLYLEISKLTAMRINAT
jgi:hypothetical protein